MRLIKILLAVLTLQFATSCSKSKDEPSLAGDWNITSAVGNDGRHWTGTFNLKQAGSSGYTGLFFWDAVDGLSTGTDSITGMYNSDAKVLTMKSVVISGNIESVTYTMNVTGNGTKWTAFGLAPAMARLLTQAVGRRRSNNKRYISKTVLPTLNIAWGFFYFSRRILR